MAKPQYSGPWQRLRKQILERDAYLCQIRNPRCTTHATHVDHIQPVTDGGAWWDPTNLRAACKNCNLGRNHGNPDDRWRKARTQITLVHGPPGINKRQYINAKPGDLIIDYDELAAALNLENGSDHKVVSAARSAILRTLRRGQVAAARAFIISSNPKAEQIFPCHTTQLIDPGVEAVAAAIRSAHGSSPTARTLLQLANTWYASRTRGAIQSTTTSRDW